MCEATNATTVDTSALPVACAGVGLLVACGYEIIEPFGGGHFDSLLSSFPPDCYAPQRFGVVMGGAFTGGIASAQHSTAY